MPQNDAVDSTGKRHRNDAPRRRGLTMALAALATVTLPSPTVMAQTASPTTLSATVVTAPTSPPVRICGNAAILNGPSTAPTGAVTVPAGDNSVFFNNEKFSGATGKTYWFAPGTHTLGTSEFGQIEARPNSTYVGAPGAVLDGRGVNRYAFSGPHSGVTIKNLRVTNFVAPSNEGTINSGAATGWTIERNTVDNNGGAGIFTGNDVVIRENCITNNGAHGISGYKPAVARGFGPSAINNVLVTRNEISYNPRDKHLERNPDGTETYCGCTGGAKFWDTRNARITDNWFHRNGQTALWADTNNVDFLIQGNYLSDNDREAIWYEISYNATIKANTLVRNTWGKGREYQARGDRFPITPLYIAEAGGDSRVSPNHTTLAVTDNVFEDNWGGVMLWEAAERFCNSPANTSAGYCTKVNPNVSHSTCSAGTINNEPYYSDCRWKTQNVLVERNKFSINKATLNCQGAYPSYCGVVAMHSKWGTAYPSWSPYLGTSVQQRMVFQSNNLFRNNTYVGEWQWRTYVPSANGEAFVRWDTWRTNPYNQDAGSTWTTTTSTTTTAPATTTTTAAPTTTTTTSAPPASGNHLNADTAGIEGGTGAWVNWYSTTAARSTEQARGGAASLKVTVGAAGSWGVTFNNWPGFNAAAGNKAIRFSALAPLHGGLNAKLTVKWKDAGGADLATHTLLVNPGSTWRDAAADVVAPVGTAKVYLQLTGTSAPTGAVFYFDQFYAGTR
jgi:hypothetical protein